MSITNVIKQIRDTNSNEPEHIASERCWCNPAIEYTDPETGISVWLHRMIQ